MNQYDLNGASAVVTGAARGIGFAVADRLLDCGAVVTIWDVDGAVAIAASVRLGEKYGADKVQAICVDLCDADAAQRATDETVSGSGSIDILVNSAGIAGPSMPLWEYPINDWRRVIEVDLIGIFHACRSVIPIMIAKGNGHIVNVASVAGKEGNPNMSAYSAAKAGVIGLTKSLGKELATTGVIVNCVTPATVNTEILKQFSEQQIQDNVSKIPMGRLGTVEENANLIAWLCSPDCSFSTGAVFDISGGRCTY